MTAPGVVGSLAEALDREKIDLVALGVAWARLSPTIAIVPAFGLRAVPAAARATLGLILAVSIAPAVRPIPVNGSWAIALGAELAKGVPLALATAAPLWAATMIGGTIDALRGASDGETIPIVEGRASPLATLFAVLVSLAFLASGGPSRVALAAASIPQGIEAPFAHAATTIAAGITIAVAIASPIVAAAIVIEVGVALVGRAANPANVGALASLVRGVAVLAVTGLLFDRLAGAATLLGTRLRHFMSTA